MIEFQGNLHLFHCISYCYEWLDDFRRLDSGTEPQIKADHILNVLLQHLQWFYWLKKNYSFELYYTFLPPHVSSAAEHNTLKYLYGHRNWNLCLNAFSSNTSKNRNDDDLIIVLSYIVQLCFDIPIHSQKEKARRRKLFTENNLYAGDSRRTSSVCHRCPKVQEDFPWHLDKVQV